MSDKEKKTVIVDGFIHEHSFSVKMPDIVTPDMQKKSKEIAAEMSHQLDAMMYSAMGGNINEAKEPPMKDITPKIKRLK